jgi:hypothetical protein
MLEQVKRILVDSFIAGIGLGYLLAQIILYFINIFTSPVSLWIARMIFPDATASRRFPLEAALPQVIAFALLLALWYVLLRWLYLTPLGEQTTAPKAEPTA